MIDMDEIEDAGEVRLNKYLSEMGVCSRRDADRLIEQGKVTVDGKKAVMGQKVMPGQLVICDGEKVGGGKDEDSLKKPKPVLLMANKPVGIVCTTTDNDRAENIIDMVQYPTRVYPIGRLDKDSEGLILLTNQGELVNKILRASNENEKEYVVKVDKILTDEFLKQMAAGVYIRELKTKTRPCEVRKTGLKEFHIILTQGLNRQVRRMCGALGYKVISLKRIRIMNLRLGNLKLGTCRKVTRDEYAELMDMLEED